MQIILKGFCFEPCHISMQLILIGSFIRAWYLCDHLMAKSTELFFLVNVDIIITSEYNRFLYILYYKHNQNIKLLFSIGQKLQTLNIY
jgi:hypothetical protein